MHKGPLIVRTKKHERQSLVSFIWNLYNNYTRQDDSIDAYLNEYKNASNENISSQFDLKLEGIESNIVQTYSAVERVVHYTPESNYCTAHRNIFALQEK